jgi:hypothetical protein
VAERLLIPCTSAPLPPAAPPHPAPHPPCCRRH